MKSYGDIFKAPEYSQISEALRKFITQCKGMNYTPKIATVKKWADLLVDEGRNSPEYAMRIVNQSIDKGWKALYPLKKKNVNSRGQTYKPLGDDAELAKVSY